MNPVVREQTVDPGAQPLAWVHKKAFSIVGQQKAEYFGEVLIFAMGVPLAIDVYFACDPSLKLLARPHPWETRVTLRAACPRCCAHRPPNTWWRAAHCPCGGVVMDQAWAVDNKASNMADFTLATFGQFNVASDPLARVLAAEACGHALTNFVQASLCLAKSNPAMGEWADRWPRLSRILLKGNSDPVLLGAWEAGC